MEVKYLQLRTHPGEYPPEDLNADIENLRDRADSVPTQGQAKILSDSLNECGGVVGRAGVDYGRW